MGTELLSLLSAAASDFQRAWKHLLAADIAFKAASFAILTPLSGLILRAFLWSQGTGVIADKDILWAALSPIGLAGLIVLAAVAVAIIALELANLMWIGFGAKEGMEAGFVDALRFTGRRAAPILELAMRAVSLVLLWAAPFLLAAALVGLGLLTEFDINFYLDQRPPAFWLAASLIGLIAAAAAAVLTPRLAGWSLALPLVLFEGTKPGAALRESARRTKGHRKLLATLLLLWAALSALAATLAFGAVRLLGSLLAAPLRATGSELLVIAVGAAVLVWLLANEAVSLVTISGFALLLNRSHGRLSNPEDQEAWHSARQGISRPRAWRLPSWGLLTTLAVAALLAALVGLVLIKSVRVDSEVEIIAHRGAAAVAPENTLAAFESAIEAGADWVELDVLETADGEVVVVHDRDLMRVAGVNLEIADATYAELREIDVGSWFGPEFGDQRVPLLAEALETCRDRIGVVIELKYFGRDERLEERVVEIVEALGMESQIVVMSLNHDAIRLMRSLRPGWRLGLITAVAIGNLTTVDADFLAINGGLATPLFLRSAHAAGKDAYVWPIYDAVEKARMTGRGADGLITNDPALGRHVLAQLSELSPAERLLVDVALWMGIVPEAPLPETNDLDS
jgi:glycerophosphoryl diester phosphodiesterase